MHSMIGSAGRGRSAGQLYGEHQPASGFATFGVHGDDDDVGSVFFQSPGYGAGADAGGGLTEYLQGFLDPATHFDVATTCDRTNDAVKPGSAAGDRTGHDGRHSQPGDAEAAPVATPNSSTSSQPRRGKKGRPAPEEGDDEGEVDEEGSVPDHQNSRSDVKKQKKGKVEKKARGSRVAFATKSEVDHLDDGYRWRKYGQKAVKNSSFPRSYYRCTAARCGVKKQVERSQHDPSTVVTTYEGQHAHPSPAAHRGPMATGANGLYSLTSLQQQRHGFCPSPPDDLLLAAAARAMAPPAAAASPPALLPRQAEHRFAEYYGMQLQDGLLDPLADIEHGHR